MSYETQELSEHDGQPRELYWFMRGTESWTYTSGDTAVVFEGFTFEPINGLSRSNVRDGGERSRSQMTVRMPYDTPVAEEFIGIPATKAVWLYLYRIHDDETDYRVTWQGRVRFGEFSGNAVTLTLDNILTSLKKANLRHLYQNQCNHFTFDENCGLSEATYSHTETILSITDNVVTAANAEDAEYFTAGQIKRSNGDRRFVISNTEVAGTHTLTLLTPFEDMEVGEEVTLIGGACRHTFTTCPLIAQPNYGGYPKVPRKNPFKSFN